MSAELVDGRAIAGAVRTRVKAELDALGPRARPVRLASVAIGEQEASEIYLRQKTKACEEVGIVHEVRRLPSTASHGDVADLLRSLNGDAGVGGIILELPLPKGLPAPPLVATIDPAKDADCATPTNLGRLLGPDPPVVPATPGAVMEILRQAHVPLRGAEVAVVNHSPVVGKPLTLLLLQADASVRVAHVHTKDLSAHTRGVDVLVVAAGVPGLIRKEHVRPGATVIDVGMNLVGGKVCGDVAFDEVREVAGRITPVPGGVGPVTVATLLSNCSALTRRRLGTAG